MGWVLLPAIGATSFLVGQVEQRVDVLVACFVVPWAADHFARVGWVSIEVFLCGCGCEVWLDGAAVAACVFASAISDRVWCIYVNRCSGVS